MLVPEVRTRSMLARRAGCWLPAAQRMPEAAPACSGHGPLRSARPQSLYHHPAPERSWLQLAKVRAPPGSPQACPGWTGVPDGQCRV